MRGFSLVELSIVLVILGLLTGGILAGQNLIRASELRAVTTEFDRYLAATHTFRDKYFALPGDMRNATDFWGEFGDAGPGSCNDTPGTGTETCNGNSDGEVSKNSSTVDSHEMFQFWKQLANAGLVEGSYTGVGAAIITGIHGACDPDGTNCPRSKLGQATWQPQYFSGVGSVNFFPSKAGTSLTLGKRFISSGGSTNNRGAVISTEEAWNIDTKKDDGKPGTGSVITYRNGASVSHFVDTRDCADDTDAAAAEYDFSQTGLKCALVFFF